MILRSLILRSALVIGALFLIEEYSFSQGDELSLLPGSEHLTYDDITGRHTLVGNVSFTYQGNRMFCDSAIYQEKSKTVWAYGNVHINKKDTLNLFCDSLRYNDRTKLAKLWGHVRVRDSEYKLTTDSLDYDTKLSQASYKNGGKVEGMKSREVLTSRIGYLHPESKNFFFSNDVVYKGERLNMTTDTLRYLYSKQTAYFYGPTDISSDGAIMYCESGWYNTESEEGSLQQNAFVSRDSSYISGDTLLYQPKLGSYTGIGNVYYIDSTENLEFTGHYAYSSDSLYYTLLTGDAIATKMMDNDTLHIHADTLYNYKQDTLEILKAFNDAAIYSTGFQAIADSIVYDKLKEKIELHTSPIVWSNDSELKGKFIDMDVNDSTIHRVNIYDKGTIISEVEPGLYYNQIAGNEINAHFKENELYQAYVYGNAMTIAFPEDEEETDSTIVKKRKGMNRLYSSDIRIDLDSNEIVGITYIKQADGIFYPMQKIAKDEQFVHGFEWLIHRRPTSREDLILEDELKLEGDIKLEEPQTNISSGE